MKEPTESQKQQLEKFREILHVGKQRYVEAGGDPRRYQAGFKDQDYLTDEERQEAVKIMRQIFGVTVKDGYVHCQGRSWKLSNTNATEAKIEE